MTEPTIDDLIIPLPLAQKVPIVALKKLFNERKVLDEMQEEQINKISHKYELKMEPLLKRISQLIQGGPVNEVELKDAPHYFDAGELKPMHSKGKLIDDYWFYVIDNSSLAKSVSENDENALKYLIDIQIVSQPSESPSSEDISLRFVFKQNPYFKDTSIVKHVRMREQEALAIEGSVPEWKEGKSLFTYDTKKTTNKKTGETKTIKGPKHPSFFDVLLNWSAQDQKELDRVAKMFTSLRDLVTNSLDYFLGLAANDEQDDEDDEEDQDEEGSSSPEEQP